MNEIVEPVSLRHFKLVKSYYTFFFFIANIIASNLPWVPLSIFLLNNEVMHEAGKDPLVQIVVFSDF